MKKCKCAICLDVMDNLDHKGNQPSGGLEFSTFGHYGSAVFDPMDGTGLAINICDDCLSGLREKGVVLSIDPRAVPSQPRAQYGVWKKR